MTLNNTSTNYLPERDAVVSEMESYAAEHRVPIIGPAVARLLALVCTSFRSEANF